ncbi:replication factor-a protein 1 (rpa1) [Vittaforma corneae ATCC 50505]|uniref:Replication protein A subunit n=1 Tax=Vittaforma corneae (strain ATCC 50505) TaxID=993615 RepID=L2GP95_VITCO|nr:replication factor-a protein 1 (rpa1) [Vittaforma corneae ATCC 50505]ELA42708.1 replication factor-a protein 1 (rpa1) [Vittaforma corneae ATCC 50505]
MKLQSGTVQALYYSQKSNPLYSSPILQITTLSKFSFGPNEKYRYKANLSDGTHYMKAVFSSELANIFDSNEIARFYVIKLGSFTVRPKDNSNYLYIQSIAAYEKFESEFGHSVNISSGKPSFDPSGSNKNEEEVQKENSRQSVSPKSATNNEMHYATLSVNQEDVSKRFKEAANEDITDIKKIFPHKKTFKFKGRVVSKTEIKKFTTQKGDGQVFSFEIADCTGQIKCVAFSECVDTFYPLVENNKAYVISNVTVKPSNKKFSNNTSDFEIHLEKNTIITKVEDDNIPKYMFKFVKIADLASVGGVVDCLAVIKEAYPVGKITIKSTGRESAKRDLMIIDQTGSCRLTLWGPKAEEEYEKDNIICLGSVKVGDYNGINLTTVSNSQVIQNIELPEAIELLAWYEEKGRNIVIEKPKRIPKRSFISEVKDNSLEYATIQGSVVYLKEEGLFYEACPSETCNKKVLMEDNGIFRCEKCNYTFEKCNYRYMINIHVGDFTGQMWITIFDEGGKSLLGVTAAELKEMGECNPENVHNLIKGIYSKELQFRLRNKEENYNGDIKLRSSCLEISPVDYVFETKRMLEAIEKVSV